MNTPIPMVKVTYHRDSLGIRRPNREMGPRDPADLHHVGAQLLVDLVVGALIEEVNVHLSEHGSKRVGILLDPGLA